MPHNTELDKVFKAFIKRFQELQVQHLELEQRVKALEDTYKYHKHYDHDSWE